ncbi:MAG: hypothetical protein SWQ30_10505 [Thermodesulfobacteriota bacterium]|nr:hypothetical protein [Thermodesulfobacteriota bacterium]
MKIDIDRLSEKELIELNHRIVERLRFLESARRHKEMMEFNIGERVRFSPPGRETQFGLLVKYNKKTVTVVTEQGDRWNVSPFLLAKVKPQKGGRKKKGKLIKLQKARS